MKAEDKLLDFLDMVERKSAERFSFKMIGGDGILTGISNQDECAVAYLDIPNEGMSSEWHVHSEHETFIWQSGSTYYMEIKGMSPFEISESRSFYVQANTPHRVFSTEGASRSLVVLVPGSTLFPEGVRYYER